MFNIDDYQAKRFKMKKPSPLSAVGSSPFLQEEYLLKDVKGGRDYEEEEQEFLNKNFDEASKEMQAYDEWKKIPASQRNSPQAQSLYFKWHGQPNRTRSQFEYLTGGRSSRPDWMCLPEMSQEYRARGGEVRGPGTGTSDSIPARLSDGEFVMTADAVRNAGGGDRNLGAARMYDMMRRFEGGTA